jgi:hypothetical protein
MTSTKRDCEALEGRYVYEVRLTQRVHGQIAFAVNQPLTKQETEVLRVVIRHNHVWLRASVWQDPVEEGDLICLDVGLPTLVRHEAGSSLDRR